MSIADPLQWLKDNVPGDTYNELTLYLRDGTDHKPGAFCAGTYNKRYKHSLKAVVDWLERSPINVWPYADIEHSLERIDGRIANVELTIKIDCAPLTAMYIAGDPSLYICLARDTAATLRTLADHVYDHTKTRIFINDAK